MWRHDLSLEYVSRSQFEPFHARTHRWAYLNTHRRAGKTVALVNDMIEKSFMCNAHRPQFAYVGPTFTQAKRIAWQYMKDYAAPYFARPPQESELKITLTGDRVLYCLGADNPDSLRGMYLDGAVMDEYALFRPSVFPQIIRPALSDRNGWGVFASTPRGKNLFYDVCKTADNAKHEWYGLTLKASSSGIISAAELESLRRDMDPEEFAQEYECSFDSALKGAIYANEVNQTFIDGRAERTNLYEANLPTHVAFDLGFTDATVAIWWQEHHDGRIAIVNVDATTGVAIYEHIERIQTFQGELGTIWLPHDARAKNLQTGKSIVEQFLKDGITPRLIPNHKVRDRISAARKVFPRMYFDAKVSDDLLEALKGYRREWDDNLLMFKDNPLHDWCSDYADAFGYMCVVATASEKTAALRHQNTKAIGNSYTLESLHEDRLVRQSQNRRIA